MSICVREPQVQVLLSLVTVIIAGCGGPVERPETFEVRDSAGIRIMLNAGGEGTYEDWTAVEAVTIGELRPASAAEPASSA